MAYEGVPTVSLGGGATMPARAAESIAVGLDSEVGISYSLKEYEDLVYRVGADKEKLKVVNMPFPPIISWTSFTISLPSPFFRL
jgi:hypothetical protein